LTCPTRSEREKKDAPQLPHMHVTIDGWIAIGGEGRLRVYELVSDAIGVEGNAGLAEEELPDDSMPWLVMSCELNESLCMAGIFECAGLSDLSSQSQNIASREGFQREFAPCVENGLSSEKYAW
jgi:hypothetical protein